MSSLNPFVALQTYRSVTASIRCDLLSENTSSVHPPFLPYPDPPNSKHYFSPNRPFGNKYYFNLIDAIDDCPEYLVHLPTLQSLCSLFGLELIRATGLHQFLNDHIGIDKYYQLLKTLKVINEKVNRETGDTISDDEWEALHLYLAVVFRKKKPEEFSSSTQSVSSGSLPLPPRPLFYTVPPVGFTRSFNSNFPPPRPVKETEIRELRPETQSPTQLREAAKQSLSSSAPQTVTGAESENPTVD